MNWFSRVVALVSIITFSGMQLAWAETVNDGSCSNSPASASSSTGGRADGARELVASTGNIFSGINWGRVGNNAWAFAKGAAIGFATGVAVTAGIALAVATFPAWGTAIVVTAVVAGVALTAYSGYQVYKNWDNISEEDRYELAGGIVGGIAAGGVKPTRVPGVGRLITNQLVRNSLQAEAALAARAGQTPLEFRVAQNARLRAGETLPNRVMGTTVTEDLAAAAVSKERYTAMQQGKLPLTFENEAQFSAFKRDLAATTRRAGLTDAELTLKGSGTSFYSNNPGKGLGKHFDMPGTPKSDVDIQLVSRTLSDRANGSGITTNPKYNVFKSNTDPAAGVRGIHEIAPELKAFDQRWSRILGRDVETKVIVDPSGATSIDGWILGPK